MNGKWVQNRGDLGEKRMTIETPGSARRTCQIGPYARSLRPAYFSALVGWGNQRKSDI
jgi:hypothetical protein